MTLKIFKPELYKIFSNRLFIIFLVILMLLNGFFLYNGQIKGNDLDFVSAEAKLSLEGDLQSIESNEQKTEFIENKINSVYDEGASLYTGDSYSDRRLLENTKNQLEIVSDYRQYAKSIVDESQNLTGVSVFADGNSFSNKNAVKTAETFEKLLDVQTVYDNSYGVNTATDFLLTDLIVILLLFIISDSLIGSERSINITPLQRTCKRGRGKLAIFKVIVAFSATAIICAVFYGMNFIISGLIYGFGDVFRPIQSVQGFADCPLKISVLQFLIIYILSKLLVMFLVCLVLCVFAMLGKSRISASVGFIVLYVISYVPTRIIGDNTSAMWLKYINLVSFIDTNSVFKRYRNINLFGFALNYISLFWIFNIILIIGFVALNIVIYKYRHIQPYNKYGRTAFIKKPFNSGSASVIVNEMYKALIINKTGLVLLILILFQITVALVYPLNLNEEEKYEKYYFTYLSGSFNDEKEAEIKDEQYRLEAILSEKSSLNSDYEQGLITEDEYLSGSAEYGNIEEEYEKFNKYVTPYYEYLSEQKQSGKNVGVINFKGFTTALGIDGDISNLYCLLLYVLIIFCTVPVFAGEYERKTTHLLSSTKTGFKRLMFKKLVCSSIMTLFINVLIYVPYLMRIMSAYGMNSSGLSACSIPAFGNYPDNVSILHLIIFVFAIRVLVSLAVTALTSGIAILTKSTTSALIICLMIFAIPLLLPLNNINLLNNFSLYYLQNFSGVL
ncbi:MAG: ABC transporter permease subunit [Acutalibacteraceae bacterium]